MRQNDQIVGSIVINHVQEENYQLAAWKIDAQDHEVYVIHTLAVHPQFKGLKIAQKLLEYADELAKNNGVKTIRLKAMCRQSSYMSVVVIHMWEQ